MHVFSVKGYVCKLLMYMLRQENLLLKFLGFYGVARFVFTGKHGSSTENQRDCLPASQNISIKNRVGA